MAQENSVLKLDVHVQKKNFQKSLFQILESVKSDWKKEDIHFKTFTEGRINTLIACYVSDNQSDMVMIRIYAEKCDDVIDRKVEADNIMTLSKMGYAPELYAFFENGFCYKYFPGKCLTIDTITEPNIWRHVAQTFAILHSIQNGQTNSSEVFVFTKEHLMKLPDTFPDSHIASRFPLHTLDRNNLLKELAILEKQVEGLKSPVVFCHGDPIPENIIWNESENTVKFIDFEFSSYNYQAFDIAFHFCEFAGVEDPDYTRFPSEEFQKKWLQVYLEQWHKENSVTETDTENDVLTLYKQVNGCVPAVHFVAGVVSTVMGITMMETTVLEYAATRFEQYFRLKE